MPKWKCIPFISWFTQVSDRFNAFPQLSFSCIYHFVTTVPSEMTQV